MAGFSDATKYDVSIDSGVPTGKMYHIACKTWTTTTGKMIPLSFKFEDDANELQLVREIQVLTDEEKNYSGIPSREYGCNALIGGFFREFKLICYLESCKWIMMI